MFARKGCDLVAVSADGHGTPAAAVRAGIIVKEEAATRIGAEPQPCAGALGDEFRCRTGYRSEQPVEAALTGYEFDSPHAVFEDKFVVSFGDAQDIVDRLGPFAGYFLLAVHGCEDLTQGDAELTGFLKQTLRSLRIGFGQGQELSTAFGGNNAGDS
jgi:hypothetical protein